MNNRFKKSVSLFAATVLAAVSLTSVAPVTAIDDTVEDGEVIFTAEVEELDGATLWTSIYSTELPGYSGDGFAYLTGETITMEVDAPVEGMYDISVRYTQILDTSARTQTICVNGVDYTVDFPYTSEWTDISMGLFRLKEGTNTITLKPQYGYASYDTITISKAVSNDYSTATDTPCDPDATDETKALMKYLKSVYGEHILSGQQEIYGGGNDGDSELEFDWIEENFGVLPAIRGFDFMNYNPLYGWEDGTTDRIIDWVKNRNGIATACWHINIPVDFDNYEVGDAVDWTKCSYKNYQDSGSSFNTANVLVEGTKERAYFDLAVEDLAEQLLKLQDAGVPLIFRPLHEAQGNDNDNGGTSWFWWGDRGSAVYTELWKLLYTELTDDYGLHNIIWEFNSYDYSTSASWYPGDDYVDIVGYDKYNTVYNRHDGNTSGPNVDAIASTFKSLYDLTNGTKMVSMPENDTVPTVDNMVIENANWLYFCPWYGEHLMDSSKNDPETLKEIYTSEYCITLDELPSDLYVLSDSPVVSTTTAATTSADITTTTTTVVGDICYGDADCDGDVDVDDIVAVTCYVADPVANPLSDDALVNCDVYGGGDGVNGMDALSIQKFLVRIIDELPVTE